MTGGHAGNGQPTRPESLRQLLTSHPNSLTALGYPRGNLAFRWFLADGLPARPEVKLVKVSEAPSDVH